MINRTLFRYTLRSLFLCLIITGCAVNPVSGKREFVMMSEQAEIKMGRDAHQDIAKQYGGDYDNDALQAYVQRVGEGLAANSHRSNLVFQFRVLDSPMVNAFALPGGYIYITRGLLAYLNSEAELAAVLGHEIGHVTARHSVRQMSAGQAAELGYTLGSIFVPELRSASAQNLFNVLGGAIISGYGREHELEADRLGAEYLARSGYDPGAMIEVIGVLKNQELFDKQIAEEEGREPRTYHGLFASHPSNDRRLQEVVASAKGLGSASSDVGDREGFINRLDGLVFGDSEQAGILREGHFYHKAMGFVLDFPAGWKVDNLPDRLLAQPPGGDAVLQILVEDLKQRNSPRDFLTRVLKSTSLSQGQSISPDGLEGYTGLATIDTPYGKRPTRFSVVYLDNRAFVFMGAGKDARTPHRYDSEFLKTAQGFHRLSVAERKHANSLKIKIIKSGVGANVAALAGGSALTHHAADQLRLLNDLYPSGEPEPGRLLKIVE